MSVKFLNSKCTYSILELKIELKLYQVTLCAVSIQEQPLFRKYLFTADFCGLYSRAVRNQGLFNLIYSAVYLQASEYSRKIVCSKVPFFQNIQIPNCLLKNLQYPWTHWCLPCKKSCIELGNSKVAFFINGSFQNLILRQWN